jgi:hypothetical protein
MKFIWNKKPAKVKYRCMINTISEGGLKLQDLATKINACQIAWIKKLQNEDYEAPWKTYIGQQLKCNDLINVTLCNLAEQHFQYIDDEFYKHIFTVWANLHYHEPYNSETYCREIVWNNSHILVAQKPVMYQNWHRSGINFIADLLNEQGVIANKYELENKFGINIPHMQYNSLISAIPKKWIAGIESDRNATNYVIFYDCKLDILDTTTKIAEVKTNDIYRHLVSQIAQRPSSEAKWQEKVGLNFKECDWEEVYLNAYQLTRESKIQTFNFKITHRTLACKYNLKIWQIENDDRCNYCKEFQDCIEHHIVACTYTRQFWNAVLSWWKVTMITSFPLDTYDILFGLKNENNNVLIKQLNYILLQGTYYVYTSKRKYIKLNNTCS